MTIKLSISNIKTDSFAVESDYCLLLNVNIFTALSEPPAAIIHQNYGTKKLPLRAATLFSDI